MRQKLYSVIIAGGKGTRFWPLSRSRKPKQLLKLFGPKTLLDETADRVLSLGGSDRTLIVTVAEQLNAVRKELSALPRKNFLAEPEGKNTAPCIGLAALEVIGRDPDAVMIILPADHWVSDVPAFRRTLKAAAELAARHDRLVTIGIQPAYPETGYGYIVKGKPVADAENADAYHVKKFKEKPNAKIAAATTPSRFSMECRHLRLESIYTAGANGAVSAGNSQVSREDCQCRRRQIAGNPGSEAGFCDCPRI